MKKKIHTHTIEIAFLLNTHSHFMYIIIRKWSVRTNHHQFKVKKSEKIML